MQTLGLYIRPLDVLFFRDGRPFGPALRGRGGLPSPQVLLGALRTALWGRMGMDWKKFGDELKQGADPVARARGLLGQNGWAAGIETRGPWLFIEDAKKLADSARRENKDECEDDDDKPEFVDGPVVPVPADLQVKGKKRTSGEIVRLKPRDDSPPGWQPPEPGMRPLWHTAQPQAENTNASIAKPGMRPLWNTAPVALENVSGFLTSAGLKTWCEGGIPGGKTVIPERALLEWEDRTGLGIDVDSNKAKDGDLYSARFLRLKQGVRFYAELLLPDGADAERVRRLLQEPIRFGGESKLAAVEVAGKPYDWPRAETGGRAAVLLLTPGVFEDPNWRPKLDGMQLVSAAVQGADAISGWDYARGCPKPTVHAVRAGSVYFVEGANRGDPASLCQDEERRRAGFGLGLCGKWS